MSARPGVIAGDAAHHLRSALDLLAYQFLVKEGVSGWASRVTISSEMHKDILLEMMRQNQFTSRFCFDRVTEANASPRVNGGTASIGFIFRHIAETINLFVQM